MQLFCINLSHLQTFADMLQEVLNRKYTFGHHNRDLQKGTQIIRIRNHEAENTGNFPANITTLRNIV